MKFLSYGFVFWLNLEGKFFGVITGELKFRFSIIIEQALEFSWLYGAYKNYTPYLTIIKR